MQIRAHFLKKKKEFLITSEIQTTFFNREITNLEFLKNATKLKIRKFKHCSFEMKTQANTKHDVFGSTVNFVPKKSKSELKPS